MKMTNEMIGKIENIGGKRWTKNNMDRIYINFGVIYNLGEKHEMPFETSRSVSNFGKIWYDVETGKLNCKGVPEDNQKVINEILDRALAED